MGKAYERFFFIFGLWSSYQIWQLWNDLMPKRVGLVGTFFKLMKGLGPVVIQLKKTSAQVQPTPLFSFKNPAQLQLFQFSLFSWFLNWFCLSYSLPPPIVFRIRWPLLLTDCGWSIKSLPNLIWFTVIFLWSPPDMVSVLILDSRKYGHHQIYLYCKLFSTVKSIVVGTI